MGEILHRLLHEPSIIFPNLSKQEFPEKYLGLAEIIWAGISGLVYVNIANYEIKLGESNVTGHIYLPLLPLSCSTR